jgi:hypothetical protein
MTNRKRATGRCGAAAGRNRARDHARWHPAAQGTMTFAALADCTAMSTALVNAGAPAATRRPPSGGRVGPRRAARQETAMMRSPSGDPR